MATGSGAIVVHRQLEQKIEGYRIRAVSPKLSVFPELLSSIREFAPVTHTGADLSIHAVHPDSKLVTMFHNFYLDDFMLKNASALQRVYYKAVMERHVKKSIKRANKVIAVSDFTANLVSSHFAGCPVDVIKNGVDDKLFAPFDTRVNPDDRPIRVLFCGNPTRRKGGHLLAQVAEALPENSLLCYTSFRESAVGYSSPKLQEIKPVPHIEMPSIYNDADVLFFPTKREGLSLAALEAMACGLPVVTTNCSSMPELIINNMGGYLHEIDDLQGMVGSLKKLIADRALREAMGAFNRERVERYFRLQRVVNEYQSLFDSLV